MNNSELDAILKRARMPETPEESLAMLPRRIVAGIQRNDPPVRTTRNFPPQLAWVFGLAACVVIAISIGHWRGRTAEELIPANDTLASEELVRETLAMFPNQVRAIVEDDHGLNLVLSDKKDVPDSAPLYLRICDGKHCSSFVTFSGQEIQIAGQTVTVLADAHGGIILTGEQFVWSNTERTFAGNHLKIEAKNLDPATM